MSIYTDLDCCETDDLSSSKGLSFFLFYALFLLLQSTYTYLVLVGTCTEFLFLLSSVEFLWVLLTYLVSKYIVVGLIEGIFVDGEQVTFLLSTEDHFKHIYNSTLYAPYFLMVYMYNVYVL